MSLRFKFFVSFFVITFVPMLVFTLVTFSKAESEVTDLVTDQLEGIAQVQESRVNEALDRYLEQVRLITSRTQLRLLIHSLNETGEKEHYTKIKKIIADAKKSVGNIDYISVLNLDGEVIVSTNGSLEGLMRDKKEYIGVGSDDHTLVDVKKSADNTLQVVIVGPFILNNEIIGVIEVSSDMDKFISVTEDYTSLGETGEVVMAKKNLNGDALFVTPLRFDSGAALERAVSAHSLNSSINYALRGEEVVLTSREVKDYRGVSVFAATRFIEALDWGLVVKIDQQEALTPITDLKNTYLLVIITIFALIVLLSTFFVNTIMRRIQILTRFSDKLQKGNFSARAKIKSNDEFGDLAKIMNSMAERLEDVYRGLDIKIRERTQELQVQNEELEKSRKSILNALEDIEKQKQVSDVLSKDLEKFKLAVENTSDVVLFTDHKGIVLYANPSVESITGFSVKETVGRKAGELWGGLMSEKYYEEMWGKISRKEFFSDHINLLRKDGEKIIIETNIVPILDESDNIKFFVNTQRDITKEVLIDQAKTEFVSLASHQLRTPLTSIKWYSEMLLNEDAGKTTKKQKDYLNEIHMGNERMVELVNALLNVSRLELGTFDIEIKDTDAVRVLEEELGFLDPLIKDKKIKLKTELDPIKTIKMDQKMLRIIFSNLISNAVKYTPEKGSVDITLKNRSRDIVFTVEDTGYGIPKGQQDKLFTKLFRADNIRTLDTTGTGLGLYIIKSITDQIGGKITFKSQEDKGTLFKVVIPKKLKLKPDK